MPAAASATAQSHRGQGDLRRSPRAVVDARRQPGPLGRTGTDPAVDCRNRPDSAAGTVQEETPMNARLPRISARRPLLLALAAALAAGVAQGAGPMRAEARISGCTVDAIKGEARFVEEVTDEGIKQVRVTMRVEGLSDGRHAVHIHESAACEPCAAAGGHHDPGPFGETRPDSAGKDKPAKDINHPFHMGDLVNLPVRNGVGRMEHVTNRVTLSPGRLSLFDDDGSAVIIHTYEDTYCDHESELEKGCAGGPRDACGVIRRAGR
jgi:Cu-Zn family superoxide dismutase